ncbi:hypothetical protein BH09VER1_BH09VER1_51820 [soil metagenome]
MTYGRDIQSEANVEGVIFTLAVQDHDRDGHFGNLEALARKHWPISFGFPVGHGLVGATTGLKVCDGTQVWPADFTITNRWPDGSARWIHCLSLVDLQPSQTIRLNIIRSETSEDQPISAPAIRLEGDVLTWGEQAVLPALPKFTLETAGETLSVRWQGWEREQSGDLQVRWVASGAYFRSDGVALLSSELSWLVTDKQEWIEMTHRVRHRAPGCESIEIGSLVASFEFPQKEQRQIHLRQLHHAEEWLPREVRPEGEVVVEIDSGGASVPNLQMVCERPMEEYAPYLRKGMEAVEHWIAWRGDTHSLLFWAEDPMGQGPQRWTATELGLGVEWMPRPVTLRQGQGFSHKVRWQLLGGEEPDFRSAFLRHELEPIVHLDATMARDSQAWDGGESLPYQPKEFGRVEMAIQNLFRLSWGTGVMNRGDDIDPNYSASYLALGISGGGVVWSNNEYDVIYAFFHQMLRTGDGRYWKAIEKMARHALEVDFLEYHDDEWLCHASPVHSVEHVTASSYPSHIWTEGLLHYYYYSNDVRALTTATLSGDFILKHLDERWWLFTATAREGGWAMVALAELYRATHEEKYLRGGRRLRELYFKEALAEDPFFPGEAFFFIGVALLGFFRMESIEPHPNTVKVVDRVLSWRLENRLSPEGVPLDHWNAAKHTASPREHFFLDALATAYRMTGEIKYLWQMWRTFQVEFERQTVTPDRCSKTTATVYRSWHRAVECLRLSGHLQKLEWIPF